MAGFDDKILKAALRMIPQSMINGVPELIVKALNAYMAGIQHEEGEDVSILITPCDDDCNINVIRIDGNGDVVAVVEKIKGREFIGKLLKNSENG